MADQKFSADDILGKKVMISNIILGMTLIIFSFIFQFQVIDLPERSAMFPRMLLWGIAITGILMVVDAMLKRRKTLAMGDEQVESVEQKARFNATLIYQIVIPGSILMMAYFLLTLFGFYPASIFLVFVVYCYHSYRVDPKSLKRGVYLKGGIFALLVTLFMYLTFSLLLGLPAPSGVLF